MPSYSIYSAPLERHTRPQSGSLDSLLKAGFGLSFQLQIQLLSNVSVKKMPELAELLDNEEEFDELCRLPAEKILLRWFNFHLKRSGYKKEVTNFGADIKVRSELCSSCYLRESSIRRRSTYLSAPG